MVKQQVTDIIVYLIPVEDCKCMQYNNKLEAN